MRVKFSIMEASWPCVTTILPGSALVRFRHQAVRQEDRSPKDEEVHERLARERLQERRAHFAGEYQMGEV